MGVHPKGQGKWEIVFVQEPPKSSVLTCWQVNEQAKVCQGSFTRSNSSITVILEVHISVCRCCVFWRERLSPVSVSREGMIFRQKVYPLPGEWFSEGCHDKDGENEAGIGHSRMLTALLIYTSRCLDVCFWAAAITDGLCHSEASKEVERKSCLSRQ